MAANHDATPTISVPANTSMLIIDSRFRNLADTPYDMSVQLVQALVARKMFYQILSWSSPFFTHNLTNNEIRLQLEFDDKPGSVYVTYMMPWVMIKEFDGNLYEGGIYDDVPPQPGSYAAYLATSLNDLRPLDQNLARAGITVNGGNTVTAYVLYSRSKGFNIYFIDNGTGTITPFRMLDCSWIEKGHYIHGYGVFDPNTKKFRPAFFNQADDKDKFMYAYPSDAPPTLSYSRFVVVSSKELTRDRQVQSFSTSGVGHFTSELGIFPLNKDNFGVYHQDILIDNASVIPVREGTQHQAFRITVSDEFGDALIPSNPAAAFFQDTELPPQLFEDYFDDTINFQSHQLLNYLVFNNSQDDPSTMATQESTFVEYHDVPWADVFVEIYTMHLKPDTTTTLNNNVYYNTWTYTEQRDTLVVAADGSYYNQPSNHPSYTKQLYPANGKAFTATVYLDLKINFPDGMPYDPNNPTILTTTISMRPEGAHSSPPEGSNYPPPVVVTHKVGWPVNKFRFQETAIFENAVFIGYRDSHHNIINAIEFTVTQSLPVVQIQSSSSGKPTAVFNYANTKIVCRNQYEPTFRYSEIPTENYKYGKYNATVLEDDLLHQIDVIPSY